MLLRILLFIGLSLFSTLSLAQETCAKTAEEIKKNKDNLPAFTQDILIPYKDERNPGGVFFGVNDGPVIAAMHFIVDDSGKIRIKGQVLKMGSPYAFNGGPIHKLCYDKKTSALYLYYDEKDEKKYETAIVVSGDSFTMGNFIKTVTFNKIDIVKFNSLKTDIHKKLIQIEEARKNSLIPGGGAQ